MAAYRLSGKADADLEGIYEYTILNFGLAQARDYLNGLHERFARLAEQPMLGRSVSRLSSGLRRHAYRSHVMFYLPQDGGVTIVRVLHRCMDAPRHLQEDEGGQ